MAATNFGNWIRSQGNALLFDNDLANLVARLEGDLSVYARQSKGPGDSRAHAALEACREFMEKYSHD